MLFVPQPVAMGNGYRYCLLGDWSGYAKPSAPLTLDGPPQPHHIGREAVVTAERADMTTRMIGVGATEKTPLRHQ